MSKYDIGVVTFFDANNYGAALQTYALQKFLENNKISSCVINFEWQKPDKIRSIRSFLYFAKNIFYINKKKKSFKSFLSNLNYSSKYSGNEMYKLNDECKKFVVGSDQVWNSKWNNNKNAFYLTFTNEKYSYAASFGGIDSIKEYRFKYIKDDLSKFKALSVREDGAVDFLKKLGLYSKKHIDPVFLLNSKQWNSLAKMPNLSDYVLVYSLEENKDMVNFAKQMASQRKLRIITVLDSKKKKINGMLVASYKSPQEFLGLISKASVVVTNSFHGTAFSIIFKKEFYTFLQNKEGAPNLRLVDLLKDFNLLSRLVSNFPTSIDRPNFDCAERTISNEYKRTQEYFFNDVLSGRVDQSNNSQFHTEYYYAKSKNKNYLKSGRSGGIAGDFASRVIDKNGIYYGAVFEGVRKVKIDRIDKAADIRKTQNSKYVQSESASSFPLVKKDLESGKHVVFSGLSCQIYALKEYLKTTKTDDSRLLIIDFVCHGVVEAKYYRDYISYLENKYKQEISNFNFRDKKYGWDSHFETFKIQNKTIKSRLYTKLFYSNCALKNGCFSCPFGSKGRPSDITLSDAWGYVKKEDKKNGASIVQINTRKGLFAFAEIQKNLLVEKMERLEFLQPNQIGPTEKPERIKKFLKIYNDQGFLKATKFAIKPIERAERRNKIKHICSRVIRIFAR